MLAVRATMVEGSGLGSTSREMGRFLVRSMMQAVKTHPTRHPVAAASRKRPATLHRDRSSLIPHYRRGMITLSEEGISPYA